MIVIFLFDTDNGSGLDDEPTDGAGLRNRPTVGIFAQDGASNGPGSGTATVGRMRGLTSSG